MNALESTIKKAAKLLAERQLARIYKVPEDFIQTPCDFFGYTAMGRAILIEAKMRERPSLSIGSDLKPHQWMAMKEALEAGCISLIAWQKGEEIALISPYIVHVHGRSDEPRKSIPWKSIDRERICAADPDAVASMFEASYKNTLKPSATQIAWQIGRRGPDPEQLHS